MKDESGEKIMKKLAGPRAKTYLMDENAEKSKRNKKGCNKEKTYENYTDCLFNDKIILKSQERFKSDYNNVYTEKNQ